MLPRCTKWVTCLLRVSVWGGNPGVTRPSAEPHGSALCHLACYTRAKERSYLGEHDASTLPHRITHNAKAYNNPIS